MATTAAHMLQSPHPTRAAHMDAPEPTPPHPMPAPWLEDTHFWMLAGCPLSHVDAIRPFTLRFRDAHLEAEFADLAHRTRHHSVDRVFALVNLVSAILHVALQLLGRIPTGSRALATSIPFIITSTLHASALRFLPAYSPPRHRALLLIPIRIFYALLIVSTLEHLVPPSVIQATATVVARQIFLGSGSALGIWLAFGIPLLFWQGALLSLAQAAAAMYATSATVCANLDRLPQGTEITNQIWGALNSASQLCYEAYLPGSSRLTTNRSPSCPPVILFTQLLCGCLLPLAINYYYEAAWRLRFLRDRDPSRHDSAQFAPGGYAGALVATGSRCLLLAACTLLTLASMWEVCNTAAALLAVRTCRPGAATCPAAY